LRKKRGGEGPLNKGRKVLLAEPSLPEKIKGLERKGNPLLCRKKKKEGSVVGRGKIKRRGNVLRKRKKEKRKATYRRRKRLQFSKVQPGQTL